MSSFLEELREVEQAKKATGDVAREQRRKRRDAEAKAEIKAMEEKERARAAEALLLLEENDEDEGSTSSSSGEPSSSSDESSSNPSGDERANFLAQQEYRRKIIEANEEVERVRASLEADRRKIFGIQQDDGHEVRLQGDELGLPPLPPTPSIDAATILQKRPAQDTAEAKWYGLVCVSKWVEWYVGLLNELLLKIVLPVRVKHDNQVVRCLLHDSMKLGRTLHWRIAQHYPRHLFQTGLLDIEYWCTDDMCADMLTKALPYVLLKKHRAEIQGKQ